MSEKQLSLLEHMAAIEEWCKEVKLDQGLEPDECYGDVVKSYILQVDDPVMVQEIRRCTGVVW